jgi:hypothetical protein
MWWWAKFLTVQSKEELTMVAKKNSSLKKAADRLVLVSRDMRVRARMASQELFEMDRRVEMRLAVEKGLKKGRRVGRKEGMEEGMERVVSLIEQGFSLDDIKKTLPAKKTPGNPKTITRKKNKKNI